MTSLSRFIPKLEKTHLANVEEDWKKAGEKWDPDYEKAFLKVKAVLTTLPVMNQSMADKELQIYLRVSEEVINVMLL